MLWAASVLCFFGFFRAGEITLPSLNAFDSGKHLSWGDIAVDSLEAPTMLKIRLKKSKTDQLGNGADVFVGKTGCALCPVAGVLAYMAVRGDEEGPFFKFDNGQPLTKSKFTQRIRQALQVVGLPCQSFAGTALGSEPPPQLPGLALKIRRFRCWVDGTVQHSWTTSGYPENN